MAIYESTWLPTSRYPAHAGFEYVQNYLEAVLTEMLGVKVDFIVPELTLAHSNPAMAELIPLADASKAKAIEDATSKGKEAALKAS